MTFRVGKFIKDKLRNSFKWHEKYFCQVAKPIPKESNICSRGSKTRGGCIKVDADSEGVECVGGRLHATPLESRTCTCYQPPGLRPVATNMTSLRDEERRILHPLNE